MGHFLLFNIIQIGKKTAEDCLVTNNESRTTISLNFHNDRFEPNGKVKKKMRLILEESKKRGGRRGGGRGGGGEGTVWQDRGSFLLWGNGNGACPLIEPRILLALIL